MLQQSERRQGRNAEGDGMFLFPNEGWASKLPKDPKALDRSQLAAVSGCCVFAWQKDDEASRVESSSIVAACGHLWPLVATCGRLWPLVAACGYLWPFVTRTWIDIESTYNRVWIVHTFALDRPWIDVKSTMDLPRIDPTSNLNR